MKIKIKPIIDYILLAGAFISILILGIMEKQDVIKLIPALFALFVYILASKAYRIAYIIGAINSALYSIGYFMQGLYGNAFVSLFLYVPLQIFTFIQWSKQKYKQATKFKRLPLKYELLLFGGAIIAWLVCWYVLSILPGSSSVPALDAAATISGPITATITMFALMETIGYELILTGSNAVMWIILLFTNPANITYLISTCFTLYCQICKAYTWIKLYREQNAESEKQPESKE